MKLKEEGLCSDCTPDEVGFLGEFPGIYAAYCVHKDITDLDWLPRLVAETTGLCTDCEKSTEAIRSRMVGGSQCPAHPDRIHVTVWHYFDLVDQALMLATRCAMPVSNEERATLIAITKQECLEANTWTEEGPYLEGLENMTAETVEKLRQAKEGINVEELLAEIALLLSGDEPQD